MLVRAWTVVALLWMIAFIGNGLTKETGVESGDLLVAALPLAIGLVLHFAVRYVCGDARR